MYIVKIKMNSKNDLYLTHEFQTKEEVKSFLSEVPNGTSYAVFENILRKSGIV